MEKICQKIYLGERSLFMGRNLEIYETVFENGESVKNTADAFFRIAQRITGKTVQLPDLYNL